MTAERELVSVVIPCYNYGRFVAEAIECALNQTWQPLEVIVVDDGSTDDTRQRLAPYLDRIRYVYQDNKGLSAARNTGIRHARGDWVALLDADDLWHPRKTERQLGVAGIDASVGLVGSPTCSEMPAELPDAPATREIGVHDFFFGVPVTGSSTLIRRNAFDLVGGFDETLTSVEDRDMWLRLAVAVRALQVSTPCWRYRDHSGQMSRNAQRMFANYLRVLTDFSSQTPSMHATVAARSPTCTWTRRTVFLMKANVPRRWATCYCRGGIGRGRCGCATPSTWRSVSSWR